jgi:hypothetical protein
VVPVVPVVLVVLVVPVAVPVSVVDHQFVVFVVVVVVVVVSSSSPPHAVIRLNTAIIVRVFVMSVSCLVTLN